jgi:hypothetical protein
MYSLDFTPASYDYLLFNLRVGMLLALHLSPESWTFMLPRDRLDNNPIKDKSKETIHKLIYIYIYIYIIYFPFYNLEKIYIQHGRSNSCNI